MEPPCQQQPACCGLAWSELAPQSCRLGGCAHWTCAWTSAGGSLMAAGWCRPPGAQHAVYLQGGRARGLPRQQVGVQREVRLAEVKAQAVAPGLGEGLQGRRQLAHRLSVRLQARVSSRTLHAPAALPRQEAASAPPSATRSSGTCPGHRPLCLRVWPRPRRPTAARHHPERSECLEGEHVCAVCGRPPRAWSGRPESSPAGRAGTASARGQRPARPRPPRTGTAAPQPAPRSPPAPRRWLGAPQHVIGH